MTRIDFKKADFLDGSYQLLGHKVIKNHKAIGILKPPIVFGEGEDGNPAILSTKGVFRIDRSTPDAFWTGIVHSDSILFGEENEVEEANTILEDPITSRNFSYFTMLAEDCGEFVQFKGRIRESTVTYLGCGGIGSISAITIAGAGVKKIRLVDHDFVEASNLNRQLFFTRNDIGKSKVEIIKERILERYPHVEVEAIMDDCNDAVKMKKNMEGSSVVLMTADDPISIVYKGLSLANEMGIKLISSGYLVNQLRVSYLTGHSTDHDIRWMRGPNFIAPSYGPTNVEVAGVVSSLLLLAIIDKVAKNKIPFVRSWDNYSYFT